MNTYFVYILASKRNGTLYTGVTNDLVKRVYEHKSNLIDGFTKKYGVHRICHSQPCPQLDWGLIGNPDNDRIETAIQREKQLKKWNRKWKLELIEKENPDWKDLYEELM